MSEFPGTYGVLFVELRFEHCHSLKMKRGEVKRLIAKIRNTFNVSAVELDYQDKWQRTLIGIASLGHNRTQVEQGLRNVEDFVERSTEGEMVMSAVNVL